jgi:hypothetical protein
MTQSFDAFTFDVFFMTYFYIYYYCLLPSLIISLGCCLPSFKKIECYDIAIWLIICVLIVYYIILFSLCNSFKQYQYYEVQNIHYTYWKVKLRSCMKFSPSMVQNQNWRHTCNDMQIKLYVIVYIEIKKIIHVLSNNMHNI